MIAPFEFFFLSTVLWTVSTCFVSRTFAKIDEMFLSGLCCQCRFHLNSRDVRAEAEGEENYLLMHLSFSHRVTLEFVCVCVSVSVCFCHVHVAKSPRLFMWRM